jgi:hypothetical protein
MSKTCQIDVKKCQIASFDRSRYLFYRGLRVFDIFFKSGGKKKIMKIRGNLRRERGILYIDIFVHVSSI